MKLDEALQIPLHSINREINNIVKQDKDVPRSSELAKSIFALIGSGGKRLRPLMVVVGSRFGPSPDKRKIWRLAAAAEFIHAASLIHDDIIDDSPLRRGQAAVHTKIGVEAALHVGNYMSARVIELITSFSAERERFAYDLSALATTQLCIGEYQQLTHAYDYSLTIEEYLEKSRNKTSQLMATCLRIGALAAGAEEEVADRLYDFGDKLGLSFQIRDDVLDFTASEEQLGKPAGSDLHNGQVTLPVLYALEDPALAPLIRAVGPDTPAAEISSIVAAIKTSGALERTEAFSRGLMEEAQQIAESFSGYAAQANLYSLLDYFGGRSH